MKLVNPTDDELNCAFAERVAGWRYIPSTETKDGRMVGKWMDESGGSVSFVDSPDFCSSADAVLPWLEKHYVETDWVGGPVRHYTESTGPACWRVRIPGKAEEVEDSSFPRACVIALLRAYGVEVEITK